MKSWITFFMPDDEYKEKKMLNYLAEGGIILFLLLIAMLITDSYINLNMMFVLLASIGIYVFYVYGRYIVSGLEYTEVATEHDYKKELKAIVTKTIGFVIIFMSLFMLLIGIPATSSEWVEIIGLLLSISIVWFFTSFISLRRSYKKNMKLQ